MRSGSVFQRCTRCNANIAPKFCRCRGSIENGACVKCGKTPPHATCDGTKSTWAFSVAIHPRGSVKSKVIVRSGFAAKREARDALHAVQGEASTGQFVEPSKLTLGAFLDTWLEGGGRLTKDGAVAKPGTYDARVLHVESYIKPHLGSVPLQALDKLTIQAGYARLGKTGRIHRGGSRTSAGLNEKTIFNVHTTLSRALADAVAARLIRENPCKGAMKRPAKVPAKHWNADVLAAFYQFCRESEDRLYPLWRFAGQTGGRRGELGGVEWPNLDYEAGEVTFASQRAKGDGAVHVQTLKGNRGRTVSVDPVTLDLMREWRKTQVAERLALGAAYHESSFIFTAPDGSPYYPDSLTKQFGKTVERFLAWYAARFPDAPVPPVITLHGLRHSHAAALLKSGGHMRMVQDRFGHSSWTITADTYAHLDPGADRRAADSAAAMVDGFDVPLENPSEDGDGQVLAIGGER